MRHATSNGGVGMKRIPQGFYTKELREEAVKTAIEAGLKWDN